MQFELVFTNVPSKYDEMLDFFILSLSIFKIE